MKWQVSLRWKGSLPRFYIIGKSFGLIYDIKALRAGCARRNKEILPLCGIAAARKVGLPTLFNIRKVLPFRKREKIVH